MCVKLNKKKINTGKFKMKNIQSDASGHLNNSTTTNKISCTGPHNTIFCLGNNYDVPSYTGLILNERILHANE